MVKGLTVSSAAAKLFFAMPKTTDLRQKVLDASLTLIGEGGLDRLSMREAARKAGVSHQAPYHHFGDREAILAALAGEGFLKLGQALSRAGSQSAADPVKAVEAMGRAYVDFALRNPAYFQAMFRADAVPLDNYPEARRIEDEAFGGLVEGVGQAFADQPPETQRAIAVACWAMVHGLATLILEGSMARKLKIPKARQKQIADEVIGTFFRFLTKAER